MKARAQFALLLLGVLLLSPTAQAAPPKVKSRAVSLRVLQQTFAALKPGQVPARELLLLCGLTRVEGYTQDRSHHDLVLFGQVDPAGAPLYTEDFVVALRNASYGYLSRDQGAVSYAYPGCSIDPDPKVVQQLSDLGAKLAATSSRAEVDALTTQWEEIAVAPQRVVVNGVPLDSHFALVMVTADYYLKRLVDGSASADVPGVTGLVDLTLAAAKEDLAQHRPLRGPAASYNRFWFFPGQTHFEVDGEQTRLVASPVTLLTEEQYLTERGVAGLGKPSPLAKQFADSFTTRYAAVAQAKPIYRQLQDLFRFAALAQAMRYQRVNVNLDYLLGRFPVPKVKVPTQVPGVSHLARYEPEASPGQRSGYLVLPSCGGVSMDLKLKPGNFSHVKHPPTKGKRRAAPAKSKAVTARPSPKTLYWDY